MTAILVAIIFGALAAISILFNQVHIVRKKKKQHGHTATATATTTSTTQQMVLSPIFTALRMHPIQPRPLLRKTLVLDLDETLIHSKLKRQQKCDVRLNIDTTSIFYVSKRPYLDEFLKTTSQWFNLVIYTASVRKYANPLISSLDINQVIQKRLFRDDCHFVNGNFVKDLTRVQSNLSDILIVDNSPAAYQFNPNNALPIDAWYDDPNDDELLVLLPLLYSLSFLDDVRSVLQLRLSRGALVPRKY